MQDRNGEGHGATEDAGVATRALGLVRDQTQAARGAVRLDLYKACAILVLNEDSTACDFANAVARTLEQALDHTPEVRPPDAATRSFDENWLHRLVDRCAARDFASVAFLISSRVSAAKRDSVIYLVTGLADKIDAA